MLTNARYLALRVAERAGCSTECADTALRSILTGIGGILRPAQREFLAEELPRGLALLLEGDDRSTSLEKRVLCPGLTRGNARELIASVGRVLAEELSTEAVAMLETLPGLAGLFVASTPSAPAPQPSSGSTLATGQPGSHRPIAGAIG